MNRPTHVPTEARPAPVPVPAPLASHGAAVQLKQSLAGLEFAEQERRLAPAAGRSGPVQLKGEDEGFKKVADAATPLEQDKTPASMQLPEEVTSGLTTAWGESFPGGKSQEQGGILVKDEAGQYGLKRGAAGKSGSFSTNYGDKSAGEQLVGSAHTHPYDESEGGHKGVSFSGADIANMVWQKDKLKIVEAGGTQFVLVRTAEFQKLVDEADTKEKQEKLQAEMKATWKTTSMPPRASCPSARKPPSRRLSRSTSSPITRARRARLIVSIPRSSLLVPALVVAIGACSATPRPDDETRAMTAPDTTSSETTTRARETWQGDSVEVTVAHTASLADPARRLASGSAWLALGRKRLAAGAPEDAIVCARAGLEAVGDGYAGPEVEDDTELKLAAAAERIEDGHIGDGASVLLRVLADRAALLAERFELRVTP